MFALLALLCFGAALFHLHLGTIDFVVLGLAFIALHLMFAGSWLPTGAPWRRRA